MRYFRESIGQMLRPVPIKTLQRFAGNPVVIPLYHAVSDFPLPHIQPLYPVRSVEQFKADITWLLERYRPISLATLEQASTANAEFSESSFHLTFDDGLSQVLPLASWLKEKGVSATMFVNPAFVGNKGLMHRYKAALVVARLKQERSLPLRQQLSEVLGVSPSKVWQRLLTLGFEQTDLLDTCLAAAKVDQQKFLENDQPYLNLDQLKAWGLAGHTVGAHSMHHPEYAKLGLDDQVKETLDSMTWVQDKLGVKRPAFAFPFTDWLVKPPFYEKIHEHFPGSLLFGTRGIQKSTLPQHYQRLPVERTRASLATSLRGALLTSRLKR